MERLYTCCAGLDVHKQTVVYGGPKSQGSKMRVFEVETSPYTLN